jgi:hypothetical protein
MMGHPYHKMEIAVDDGAVEVKVHCDAPAGASCRMVPKCLGLDSTTLCVPEDEGRITHSRSCEFYRTDEEDQFQDGDLPMADYGACWVITWFDGMEEILNSTESGTSVTVPIEVNWLGDFMGWSFAEQSDVETVLTKIADTWQTRDWTILTSSRTVVESAQRVTDWFRQKIKEL